MERDSGLNPIALPGQRIGLLGGSFDPAHAGHLHISEMALRRFRLDRVWWLVSPGNPLKPARGMAPFRERLASARRIADGRRIRAIGIEAALGTRYSVDTLRQLRRRFPLARFVFVIGADNLWQLPRWQGWKHIVAHPLTRGRGRPAAPIAPEQDPRLEPGPYRAQSPRPRAPRPHQRDAAGFPPGPLPRRKQGRERAAPEQERLAAPLE